MRNRIWNNMANIKFKSIYTNECHRLSDSIGRIYSFFLSFASASSVAAWAIWKDYPLVWAGIVTIAQILHLAKPYLPFMKHDKDFLEMSFDFACLYLEYERLWVNYEDKRITEEEAENKFYLLRDQEIEIEKSYKQAQCPRLTWLIDRAEQDTTTALALNFE